MISFRKEFVLSNEAAVRGFLAAIEEAVADINADKGAWQNLLVDRQLVPAPLIGSYTIPDFPTASVPSQAQFADVLAWAKSAGLVENDVPYVGSVDASYLP